MPLRIIIETEHRKTLFLSYAPAPVPKDYPRLSDDALSENQRKLVQQIEGALIEAESSSIKFHRDFIDNRASMVAKIRHQEHEQLVEEFEEKLTQMVPVHANDEHIVEPRKSSIHFLTSTLHEVRVAAKVIKNKGSMMRAKKLSEMQAIASTLAEGDDSSSIDVQSHHEVHKHSIKHVKPDTFFRI